MHAALRTAFSCLIASLVGASLTSCNRSSESPEGPGRSAALVVVSGDAQTGLVGTELADAVVVKVVDAANIAVPGQVVSFHVSQGGGSVYSGVAITNSAGLARERWTLGTTAGPQRLEAHSVEPASGTAIAPASLSATAVAAAAATAVVEAGDTQTGQQLLALEAPVVVRLTDRFGNAIEGAAVSFVPGADCGSANPASTTTDATGRASSVWTLGRLVGGQSMEARVAGLAPVTITATSAAGPLQARLALVAGDAQTGAVQSKLGQLVVVRLTTLSGEPIAGQPVWFSGTAGGQATPGTEATDAQGIAATQWQLGTTAGQQQLTAEASDPATTLRVGPVMFTATATAGAPAMMSALGDGQSGRNYFNLGAVVGVQVTDSWGNVVAGEVVTFTPSTSCGSVPSPTVTSDASGNATTTWRLGSLTGTQSLEASVSGVAPVALNATATAGGPFDGEYAIVMYKGSASWGMLAPSDPSATAFPFRESVADGVFYECGIGGIGWGSVSATGIASFAWNGAASGPACQGSIGTYRLSGTFTVDAAGNASGSGTWQWCQPSCGGDGSTWSAARIQ